MLLEILHDWQAAFSRQRSCRRAVAQALGTLTALGRRTLSRAIWGTGSRAARLERRIQATCACELANGRSVSADPGACDALVPRPLCGRRGG